MKGLIAGFTTLINILKMAWAIISNIFGTIAMVFTYLLSIINIAFNTISTFPVWLTSFAIITIAISLAYFIIGRNVGKSD